MQHQSKIEIDTAIIRYRLQKTKNPSPIFILLKSERTVKTSLPKNYKKQATLPLFQCNLDGTHKGNFAGLLSSKTYEFPLRSFSKTSPHTTSLDLHVSKENLNTTIDLTIKTLRTMKAIYSALFFVFFTSLTQAQDAFITQWQTSSECH